MRKDYDVFLSHNAQDKDAVEYLAQKLREAGLEPFLDKWHLIPGEPWQEALEEALDQSTTCAVFLGPAGLGPWENEEMRAALDERVRHPDDFRVIPVLLPDAQMPERGRLPRFLSRLTWVDFRAGLEDEDAFHRLRSGIRGMAPGAPDQVGPPAEDVCPYRGLEAFHEEHAEFFFGREALTQWLVEALRDSRFLAVVGPSGGGKSSVVRAGLIPALREGALPGSETWSILALTPGARPLEELAAHLAPLLYGDGQRVAGLLELQDRLAADERALHTAVRLAAEGEADRVLIAVDQFEELFTLCGDEGARRHFLDNLLYASGVANGRAVVVLAMRADFYPRVAAYAELADRMADHQVVVTPMAESELRAAIELPARAADLRFDAGLIDTMVESVLGQPGALPLLEHALLELWKRRRGRQLTFDAYREIGGVDGAIARRAEEEYGDLTAEQQAAARRVLLRLVQPGEGTEDTRRRVHLDELLPASDQAAVVEGVVQKLANARLLTTGRDVATGEELVDVAHEALIRGWPRLRGWIEADRAALRTHRRLTERAQEWDELGRDPGGLLRGAQLAEADEWAAEHGDAMNALEREFLAASVAELEREAREREEQRRRQEQLAAEQRARRRLRWLAAGLAGMFMLALVAAGFAIRARSEAVAAQGTAEAEADARATEVVVRATAEALAAVRADEAGAAQREVEKLNRFIRAGQLAAEAQVALDEYPQRSLLLAVEALKVTTEADEPPVAAAEQALRDALANTGGIGLAGHEDRVTDVAFDPEGHWLATGSWDGTARLWDLDAQDPGADPITLPHEGWVTDVAFDPEGRWLATRSDDGTARLWDLDAQDPAADPITLPHEDPVWAVAFDPEGRWLATRSGGDTVRLWDLDAQNSAADPITLPHEDPVWAVAFDPEGRWLATGNGDDTVRLWNLDTLGPAADPIILPHEGLVTDVAFDPAGRWLATGSLDDTARLWDLDARDPAADPITLRHEATVNAVAFDPAGRWLATGSFDGTARLWDLDARDPAADPITLPHEGGVNAVAFDPAGRWLATGSGNGTARLWRLRLDELIELACRTAGRNLTSDEWDQYFRDEAYRKTCDNLPLGLGVVDALEASQ